MTAHELIDSIFSRHQDGVAGNMRRITPEQLQYVLDLISQDDEGGAVERGTGRSILWTPSGRHKYLVTEDPNGGKKHTLTRLSNLTASETGRLF